MAATLEQVQEVFGREIAGNHTVHATLEDGAVVCSCVHKKLGLILFIGHDDKLSDWDLISPASFKELVPKSNKRSR